MTIGNLPKIVGVHEIDGCDEQNLTIITGNFITIIADGDVAGDLWCIVPDSLNYLEITSIKNDIVEGKYELTLLRDLKDRPQYSDFPDTLRFRNGYFKTRIK